MIANLNKEIRKSLAVMIALTLAFSGSVQAEVMSSGNYSIESDSVNAGGGNSASANYGLESTAGEIATGRSGSSNFDMRAGYLKPGTSTPDIIPPSIPNGLVASALSSSVIGLAWNASTDNVSVRAYHVFRDFIHIATTTTNSYTDSGLTPETAYAYTVRAVDMAYNYSAHSATSTATTTAVSASESVGNGGSSLLPLYIYDIQSNPGLTHIDLAWMTGISAKSDVYWGTTRAYEVGKNIGTEFAGGHSIRMDNLAPNTEYFVLIVVRDLNGRSGSVEIRVRTLGAPDDQGPANVLGFAAMPVEEDIELSWKNPRDLDFEEVRIVRSTEFYPGSSSEGELIYEGDAERFLDSDVEAGVTYYYTAFTKDSEGNYSSGAVASAKAEGEVVNPFENLPDAPAVDPAIENLKLGDFRFVQDGKAVSLIDLDKLLVDGRKNLRIELDYDRVPEVLKTIAITLVHPEDAEKKFTFLLKVNADKTKYEAVIGPLMQAGVYGVRISVVDHKNRGMKKLEGNMLAAVSGLMPANRMSSADLSVALMIQVTKLISLILIIILLIYGATDARRRHRAGKGQAAVG